MNLLLLNQAELAQSASEQAGTGQEQIRLEDYRATHIIRTLRSQCGDTIKVGLRGGNIGTGHIIALDAARNYVTLAYEPQSFNTSPPPPNPTRLFVALPRPKAARRIIRLAAECGVKALHFINGYKVEKSYWSSPLLTPAKIDEQIVLGLQQAMDTISLEVVLHPRFKPFVEDELPVLIDGETTLLAHPGAEAHSLHSLLQDDGANIGEKNLLNIMLGPEGGFTPYELDKLATCGAQPISLGPRIYRTEVAIATLLGELRAWYSQE